MRPWNVGAALGVVLALGVGVHGSTGCRSSAETTAEPHHHQHHHQHGMPHRFEDAEAWSKEFDDPARDAWQKPDAVLDAMELPPDAVVVDLGAGTGYFAMRFAKRLPKGRVIAIDVEPDMVRYLEQRAQREQLGNITAVQGGPEDPAIPSPVDVVFVCDTYHHISERSAYFARVRDKISSGGRLVVIDFKPDAPEGTPGPPRKHRIGPAQLSAELAEAGFEPLSMDETTLPYQYIAVFHPR